MPVLFFDTETHDGVDRFAGRGPGQLRVVQLGALLVCGDRESTLSVLVRPDGWTVATSAQRIHGISTTKAQAEGVSLAEALDRFDALTNQAVTLVAHNAEFDQEVLRGEYSRLKRTHPFIGRRLVCTMKLATPVVKLPGRHGYKWPSLEEAYRHFTGQRLQGTHDALLDAKACRVVYDALAYSHALG